MKHRKSTKLEILQPVHLLTLCLTVVLCTGILQAQHDPGPRGGAAGAGGFYPTLDGNEQAFFSQALDRFKEIDSVSGNVPGEAGIGLGPTFIGGKLNRTGNDGTVTRFGWKAQ